MVDAVNVGDVDIVVEDVKLAVGVPLCVCDMVVLVDAVTLDVTDPVKVDV